jgi:hypothetical protein
MKRGNFTFKTGKPPVNMIFCFIMHSKNNLWLLQLFIVCMLLNPKLSYSVPSYARQTGMPCSSCHTVFPQLTTFGREFKLNGYTLTGTTTIEATNEKEHSLLKILAMSPLSAMFQTSLTHVNSKIPDSQNDNVEFPQQFSLFYSGLITPHIGTFIQVTYSGQSGTIGMDNTDIRYSNSTTLGTKRLIYGFTLNNNPTVQDVWNSIPAWRFPYATSDIAPVPAASPLIEGGLAQQVAGLGAYAYFNSLLYLECSIYRSAQQGVPAPPGPTANGIIKGVAPYWRLALHHNWNNHYLEAGTTGMLTNLYPAGVSGPTDNFIDIGVDAQYEFSFPVGSFVLHPSFYHEFQQLNSTFDSSRSQNLSNALNSFRISGELYFKKGIGLTLGYFYLDGTRDDLLYQPSPMNGSRNGKPDSDGIIAEVDYLPWHNIRLSLQYVMYDMFNGAATSYDGFGRNASQNNTVYLLAWLNF